MALTMTRGSLSPAEMIRERLRAERQAAQKRLSKLADAVLSRELIDQAEQVRGLFRDLEATSRELNQARAEARSARASADTADAVDVGEYLARREQASAAEARVELLVARLVELQDRLEPAVREYEQASEQHFAAAHPEALRRWRAVSAEIFKHLDDLLPLLVEADELHALLGQAADRFGQAEWQRTRRPANRWRTVVVERLLPRLRSLYQDSGASGRSMLEDAREQWRAKGWL